MKLRFYKINLLSQACLLAGLSYGASGLFIVYANNNEALKKTPTTADFNNKFLMGSANQMDLTLFKTGNPILAGDYNIDLYVNGEWIGKQQLSFKKIEHLDVVEHCFNLKQLVTLQVDLSKLNAAHKNKCLTINEWIPEAYSKINVNDLRYDLSIPQAYLQRQARGYVPPEVWDQGINAGFLSYNLNHLYSNSDQNNQQSTYLSLNTGLNVLGWQFRHNASATWQDNEKSNYESLNTYVQKAFPDIRSVATLGESYTSGELFDSFAYTGFQLKTDDRMLPESQTGYAPIIRGVAQSNAIVEIRQNNQLIYQNNVAAGKFVIDDLYPAGFGGEMEVTVREANGQIQRFKVPYASLSQMLRPGHDRYSATVGRVRNKSLLDENTFIQATYQRGMNNHLTSYLGSLISENYRAFQLGSAFATPIGAIALDVTHANTALQNEKDSTGQSYRVSYSKFVLPTNTNFTLAAYRYSTSGYYSFFDANQTQDYIQRGLSTDYVGRQRSQFQLSLNQGLSDNWGNFYFTGSWNNYWNENKPRTEYQTGYNNTYKALSYSLSMQRITDIKGEKDDHYYLTLSMPLEFKKRSASFSQMVSDFGNNTSINGTLAETRAVSYSASVSNIGYNTTSGNANIQYRSPYSTIGMSTSIGEDYQQYGLNLHGSLVAHAGGMSFSPDTGETMVLVHAENARGAIVNNTVGLKIDPWGYAVIPSATPYRVNEISLNPKGMSNHVELESTSLQLAPYAGAIAQVNFKTKTGFPLIITAKRTSGEELPFAANVTDDQGNAVGIVTQGSQIYLRTDQPKGQLHVQWGTEPDQQCKVTYQVDSSMLKSKDYILLEGQCQ